MAHQNPRTRHPFAWAVLTVLTLAPIVGTLWVPFYARSTPQVADFPFFYWYQLMWVPIVAVTSGLAYAIVRAKGRRQPTSTGAPGGAAGPGGGRAEGTEHGTDGTVR